MEHDQGWGVEKVREGLRVNGWGLWMLGLGLWSRVQNRVGIGVWVIGLGLLDFRVRVRVGVAC